MKKVFSILSVMILLSLLAYAVALGEVYGDWEYSSSDGKTCTINKYNGSEAEVTVPSVIEGFRVTSIENLAFYNCSSLTGVKIPESVTNIGNSAFKSCGNLMEIEIPNCVKSIGRSAFSGCSSLTSIEIPKDVTSIENNAFYNCSSLVSVEIPESVMSIGDHSFSGCSSLTSIEIPEGVTSIGELAFSNCSSLTSIVIPASVTSIENGTFRGCSSLTSIEVPGSVTSIGDDAFENCSSLTSIEIPEGVTSIGNYTFNNCSSLMSIEIPGSVTNIKFSTFKGCSSLTSIEIPEGVTSIKDSAFEGCSSLSSIKIPEGVTSVGDYAFEDCIRLTSIEIPDSLTSIGGSAFYNCSSLMSIEIPEGVTSIEDSVFSGCSRLTSIEIPGSVTSIGDSAFEGCSRLTSIEIPEGVTSIGDYLFDDCSSLTSVKIPESVTSIGYCAFFNCGFKMISLPGRVRSIGGAALECCFTLKKAFFPMSVRQIGDSSLPSLTTVYCYEYSYAETWARDNGYTVVLVDKKPFSEIGSIDVRNKIYVANGVNTRVKADIFPLLPEVTVEWTSSDPEIFTVKDGVITGRKNGTATLTITVGDLSAKSEVTVVTAAEDFTLEDIYIPAKGKAEAIVTGIVPTDATLDIEWSTEDPLIASVTEESLVTGKGKVPGETTLTAVDRVTGRKRTATVYVIGPIKRVELDRSSAELLPFEGLQLNATAYTDERSFMNQQLTFASDNEAVAVVNQRGFVQAKGAGTATITATASKKVKASCQITVREAAIMLIPASATEIADGAFEGTGAELYVIPETTKIIGARAFADMKKARVIVLPEGVEADPTAFDGTDATFIRPDGTAVQ